MRKKRETVEVTMTLQGAKLFLGRLASIQTVLRRYNEALALLQAEDLPDKDKADLAIYASGIDYVLNRLEIEHSPIPASVYPSLKKGQREKSR
jgi:hypothetical protein